MNKDIFTAFAIAASVAAFGLFAHVNDTELSYDYGHQYNHEKAEFDSQSHHDGEFFPNYNDWLGNQLEKEDQAKSLIDKGITLVNQWADPFTAGVNASGNVTINHENETRSPDRDSDQR